MDPFGSGSRILKFLVSSLVLLKDWERCLSLLELGWEHVISQIYSRMV